MYIHLIYITIIVGLLYWNFIIQDNVSPYLKNKEKSNSDCYCMKRKKLLLQWRKIQDENNMGGADDTDEEMMEE